MPDLTTIGAVASLIIALTTSVVMLFKMRPEANKVVMEAGTSLVVVQSTVISTLEKQVTRLERQHRECEEGRAEDRIAFKREIMELRELVLGIDTRRPPRERGGEP